MQLEPGKPRTLAFKENVRKDYKLLELDEGLLEELFEAGLAIKGDEGEEAVLCTRSQTYCVKTVETTNSVWLVQPGQADEGSSQPATEPTEPQCTPPGQHAGLATQLQRNASASGRSPVVVTALASSHLELVPAAPRLQKLDALLQERPYEGEAAVEGGMEVEGGGGRYTREELLERVQASRVELDCALAERHTLCLDGRYCSVDPAYLGTLLEMLLLTAVEHGWAGDFVIPAHVAGAALEASGFDPRVTQHCLEVYGRREDGGAVEPMQEEQQQQQGSPGSSSRAGSASGLWRLNESAVCCHFARKLLAERQQWGMGEFVEAWQGSVPEGMAPSLEMLRGEALVSGHAVKRLAVATLPADAAGRFAALFAERERWVWEDMEPYVSGLQGPGQTVEGLLLKYARVSQPRPSDPQMYSSR